MRPPSRGSKPRSFRYRARPRGQPSFSFAGEKQSKNNKFYNSFSHESDLRLAVGKNQNALSTALLTRHVSTALSPRQTSDAGLEAHVLKAGRRLHTLDVVSQPSRTFESPRARRDAPNKRRSMLKRRVRIHERHPHDVTRQTSDGDFEARVFNATRWLWTSDEASQPSRTFEPPRACRVAQDKRALVARRKRLGNKPKKLF